MSENGTPLLLRQRAHREVATARSVDLQADLGPPAGDDPLPAVVVLTRCADREIDHLSVHLAARGVALVRLDSDRCRGQRLTYRGATDDDGSPVLVFEGRRYAPRATWLRYFRPASIRPGPDTADGSRPEETGAFVRDQWAACAALLAALPGALNTAAAGTSRPDRVAQLVAARRHGLAVPRTVVTTCPADAAAALDGVDEVVVKSLGEHYVEPAPGALRGVFPRRLRRSALAANPAVEPAPVIVQELVASARELRVHVVGDRLLCFAVHGPADGGVFDGGVFDGEVFDGAFTGRRVVEPVPLPAGLDAPLRALAREWHLDVAAFDLLETAAGVPVFLEVNTDCDWLWCERAAGVTTVTQAVAALLARRVRQGVAS